MRLVVERVARSEAAGAWATDVIAYRVYGPGPPSNPPLAEGAVHDPNGDDRLGARRVLPAISQVNADLHAALDDATQV